MARRIKKTDGSHKIKHGKWTGRTSPYVDMKRNEEWRATDDPKVLVSNLGRIKRNGRLVKPRISQDGYYIVWLNGKHQRLHRVVAKAFLDNPDNLPVIDHIDGDKTNCAVYNLRWCTIAQNTQWAFDQGLNKSDGRSYMIIAYQIETKTAEVFRSQSEAAKKLGIGSSTLNSCLDRRDKTCHGYLFFRLKDFEFKDTIGEDYYGITSDGGNWAEHDENGIRLKLVDNRDNPMTQDECKKTVTRLHAKIIGKET